MAMKIDFVQGDITKMKTQAIVNAANCSLLGGGGVDGAIHKAAGPGLLEECKTLGGCKTGEAKITKGYSLPCHFVIHTVGPIYSGSKKDEKDLFSCYFSCLNLAKQNDIHTIAFPCISTGVYGYPQEDAAKVCLFALQEWQKQNPKYDIAVTLCCFCNSDFAIYQKLSRKSI